MDNAMTLPGSPLHLHSPALLEVRKFTYRELLEMERVGIIQEDQHVELLGGQLVVMTVNPLVPQQWLPEAFLAVFEAEARGPAGSSASRPYR
jgi:hypothetical protein